MGSFGEKDRSALFDNWAESYDESFHPDGDAFPFAGYEQLLNRVVCLADVHPNMQILDLGIGTGNLAARFIDRGCQVWGLDFSARMLAQTHAKFPHINLIQANLLDDWTREFHSPFDRVVSAYVFHTFDLGTKMRLLRQIISNCLKPKSYFLVADIAFPNISLRTSSQQEADALQEEEYFWAADETLVACQKACIQVTYEQISWCGGIFIFSNKD